MGNVLIATLLLIGAAEAQDKPNQACPECACGLRPKKVCRLKIEQGTVSSIEADVKCTDYCLPGPSKLCGFRWIQDKCGYRDWFRTPIWQAHCGCVKQRKELIQTPKSRPRTVYTCVVETVCCQCGHCQVDEKATAEARAQQIVPASFDQPIILDAGEMTKPALVAESKAEAASETQPAPAGAHDHKTGRAAHQ